jgi:hypothetical protein
MDIEQRTADGKPNGDWVLEGGMVAISSIRAASTSGSGGRDRLGWRQATVLMGVWGAGGER